MAEREGGLGARRWLVVIVILLIGAEVGARLTEEKKARPTDPYEVRYETAGGVPIFHEEGLLALRRDPQTGFALAPDQVLDGKLPDGRRATVKINAQGFRGDDWRLEKPAGRARVIVAGGSAAFGVGASSDQTTVSGYLEKLVAQGAPEGRSVEVLNAGIPGADAPQEFAVAATRLLDYAPDVLVVLDGWNDFCRGILAPSGSAIVDPFFLEIDDLCAREREGARYLLRSSALAAGSS
jgi:hypothetical protein